ncbi:uncharacterized [Tachysurus ichikawai]
MVEPLVETSVSNTRSLMNLWSSQMAAALRFSVQTQTSFVQAHVSLRARPLMNLLHCGSRRYSMGSN